MEANSISDFSKGLFKRLESRVLLPNLCLMSIKIMKRLTKKLDLRTRYLIASNWGTQNMKMEFAALWSSSIDLLETPFKLKNQQKFSQNQVV